MTEFEKYASFGRGISTISTIRKVLPMYDWAGYQIMIDAEGGHRLRREVIRQIKREIFEKK